jgi:hypothetical protein
MDLIQFDVMARCFWEHVIHLRQTLNVDACGTLNVILMGAICFGLDYGTDIVVESVLRN